MPARAGTTRTPASRPAARPAPRRGAGVWLDDAALFERLDREDFPATLWVEGPDESLKAAMLAELPYPKLRDAVLAHLTMAEGLGALLANVPPLAHRDG